MPETFLTRLVNLVTTHPEFTVEFVLVDYAFDVDFETLAREMIFPPSSSRQSGPAGGPAV